ncbi:MAG: translation initiation factor IF-2 [Clostridia bacterium]|jgi:translation initiation factor IF-2|nr:translation initiation factor IF-2 [Clostridia bacterium]
MGVILLDKIKVHELAKKLNVNSKEVIEKAETLGIKVKSHLSTITNEEAEKITKSMGKEDKKKSEPKKEIVSDQPVIMRRTVIINEEEEKKVEPKVKPKKSEVGFIEKNRKKDYNIVYRNKQAKPMSVAELFGIPSKEEPKQEIKQEEKEEVIKKEEKEVEAEIKEENMTKVEKVVEEKKFVKNESSRPQRNNNFNRNNDNGFNRNNSNRSNEGFNRNNSNRNNEGFNRNNSNRNNGSFNRNNNFNNQNNNGNYNRNNGYNRNNNNGYNNNRKLDEKGIDKKINNIMAVDIIEKENVIEYSNRAIDKQKSNRQFEEQKTKKQTKKKGKNEDFSSGKLRTLKQESKLSNVDMLDYYDLSTQRGRRSEKKGKQENRNKQKIFKLTEITIPSVITVKDLATEMKITSGDLITKLLNLGVMATINKEIDFDIAYLAASEFGITAKKKDIKTDEEILFDDSEDREEDLISRPPVVVVMGHVDHGKTSLLDAIRKTNVIEGEAGGITQHIGAYKVNVNDREITFLDTPGHEAFTSMRARGAQITDIAILVVAANDGVMPQTVEAINHAKAAEIPIIVAVNKMDLPGANVEKIKEELTEHELVPEEWGGETIFVPISAKKGEGIDTLLEMVLLQADMLELKVNPKKQSKGVVIEAKLDKARGPVTTMLVQRGQLDIGDTIIVGSSIGRIRTMTNDKGKKVKFAGPSTPVEITGLTTVPNAGDTFYEVKDEKTAKHLIEKRKTQEREKGLNESSMVTLDDLFSKIEQGKLKQLNLIVKADVQGSVEAVKQSLEKLSNEEVRVKVIHSAAGGITESDVTLAKVSNAIIIGFNVRPEPIAKMEAEKEGVEIKQYSVIYNAIEDVEAAMKGMLDPEFKEVVIGNAEVRQVFKVSNVGTIAGCYVTDGKIARNSIVRVIRDNVVLHEGKLLSLKRFKDDVKEVAYGYECGVQVEEYNDIQEGDIIEAHIMEEIKR